MAKKYIDADILRKKIDEQMKSVPREVGRSAGTITSSGYGMMQAFQIIRSLIDSLQQEQPLPEDTVLFNKGVAEGRRLERQDMLKDAVEGEVCKDHIVTEKPFYFYQSRLIELPDNLKEGDKVKIVIVKEDGK